jgi:hypothetical protein
MKALCIWSIVILAATVAKASILYSQAANPAQIGIGGATSYDPLPNSADDFTPDTNWLVTGATFRGMWTTGSGADPTTPTRPFEFRFYEDANGPTDPPISTFSADASLTLAYIFHSSNLDSSTYDLAVTFPATVQLSAGSKYWFSVVDDGLGRNGSDGFFWTDSPDGNHLIAQIGQNGWTLFQQQDVVFSLIGTTVPEPSAMTMFAIALMAFHVTVHKKSRNWTDPLPKTRLT